MLQKALIFILVLTLVMGMSVSTAFGYSETDISITPGENIASVDGEEVVLDVAAKIINDRTMVPIRFVAESMGFFVDWDAENRTVIIGENSEILLPIGSTTATVNGVEVELDSPAIIEDSRTLVPIRFVSENFGAEVSWDEEERVASIMYSEQLNKAIELYGEPLTDEENEVLDALDDQYAYEVATTLTTFGDALDGSGFHLVGSNAGREASEYIYGEFEDMGLSPEYHEFTADGWEYYGAELTVHDHPELDYLFRTAPYTPATPEEGLTAEVVYVGTASKEELEGVDLTGKIALAEFDWDYTLWMNNLTYQLEEHGAEGVIYFMTNAYGSHPSGMAEFVGDWSGVYTTIPVWSMAQKEGFELAALAENETITVTAVSDGKIIPEATGRNIIAKITGNKYPEEYIIINAHTDAYNHCLQDDSAPIGIIMALAKAMVETDYEPDRTIVFLATDGEEAGGGETFYDWLVGSWALINDMEDEWGGKIVNSHTIELLAHSESNDFGYRVSNVMYLYSKGLVEGLNTWGDLWTDVSLHNWMTNSSDEWSFSYFGAPTTRTIWEDNAGWVYHSSMDNPDQFSYEKYVDNLFIHSLMMLRTDKQEFAPYDLARDAEIYFESLDEELLEAEGLDYDMMAETLEEYIEEAQRLVGLNLDITEKYNQAVEDGDDLSKVNTMISSYNQGMRDVAEEIIEGTQYVALDIVVNQTEYNQRIPKVFDEAIDLLENGNPEELLDVLYGLDSEDLGQWSVWYTEVLEYNPWYNAYWEALDMDKDELDLKWVTGRLLQYYDIYDVLERVNEKIENEETNFQSEINTLTQFKNMAEENLASGFNEDLSMWQAAFEKLPLEKAESILNELE